MVLVLENVFLGFYVIVVNVIDDDIGFNVVLEFIIVFGNVLYVFYIKLLIG